MIEIKREPVQGAPDLLLTLDRDAGAPLHDQLERSLRDHVRSGRLAPGAPLPSSRALASELGVSRGVVLEAYAQLTAEGYLSASQGSRTRVASMPSAERPPVGASSLRAGYAHDFDPCVPDLAAFPRDRWLQSLRTALREAAFADLGPGDPRGLPALRDELMDYIARVRGAAPEPEHTLVCTGFSHGLALLCRALRDRGLEQIALEKPGWAQHRLIAQRAGLEPVPIRVDEHGLDVAGLAASGCEAVVVTPSHQFPTGVVLAPERRSALLQWAEDVDGLVVEDDYDSELRYDRIAVGALQGLAPERVCCIGSASKRLAPALRLGWILSPSWLTGALTYELGVGGGWPPAIEQLALADFIARGELERHLRRMRQLYRERRTALVDALSEAIPGARISGIAAGLYAMAMLPEGVDENAVLSAAAARGIGVEGLGWHRCDAAGGSSAGWDSPEAGGATGVVLGFANLPGASIRRGVTILAEAIEEVSS